LLDLVNTFYGLSLTGDDVTELGKSILKNEREFNLAAGLSAKHDRLPDYFKKEKLPPHDITFQVTDEELDEVFNF
jgi:aldehyde:ferredoxin oxidoreductase